MNKFFAMMACFFAFAWTAQAVPADPPDWPITVPLEYCPDVLEPFCYNEIWLMHENGDVVERGQVVATWHWKPWRRKINITFLDQSVAYVGRLNEGCFDGKILVPVGDEYVDAGTWSACPY